MYYPRSNPVGIFRQNNQLLVFGQLIDDLSTCNLSLTVAGTTLFGMGLNEATGSIESMKSYCYHEIPTGYFTSLYVKDQFNAVRTGSDRFGLSARMYATNSTDVYYFKVLFDDKLTLFKPSLYRLPKLFSHSSEIKLQRNGDVNLSLRSNPANQYWAQLDSLDHIKRQRKIKLAPTVGAGRSSFDFKLPHYTTYATINKANNKWCIEYSQLQDHDPVDSCLGTDTSFVTILPFHPTPKNFSWRSIVDNPLVAAVANFTFANHPLQKEVICSQNISRCDSLRIAGPDTVCVDNGFATFTGLKNPDCRKRVLWEMDNALIDSSYQPNDSTILLRFKQPQGATAQMMQLFASAANCTVAKDTTGVVVLPGLKPLPPDTTICGSVNLRLTPGKWGKSYRWQNGSTDSVLIATDTGRYTVQVRSACGGLYFDTIQISKPIINLDSAATVCNGDTLRLRATAGFASYSWYAGGTALTNNGSILTTVPVASAQYIVQGHTAAGCAVADTVVVTVLQLPLVHLGSDTTFCTGDSLRLQAPAGAATYRWSNGSAAPSIAVYNSGSYWLKLTDAAGCSSADTLVVRPLYSKPIVNLLPKNTVCFGQTDTLRTTQSFTSYQWQNGSTAVFHPVSDTGRYWVSVTDANGCRGSDTAVITKMVATPSGFLPSDTTICAETETVLGPLKNFDRYRWSTGASTTTITVSSAGLYALEVTDRVGCTGKDSTAVSLKACPNKIHFPSAFSPNGDGRNDLFKPVVEGRMLHYSFTVYNRWGGVVFTTTDYRKGWNGTLASAAQAGDVFVWLCQWQFSGEEKKVQKGTVTLVR